MADNWLERQKKLVYPWDKGHPPPEGSHRTPFKPPSKDWARYQTNEYLKRLKAELAAQVEAKKIPDQANADALYQEAVTIINTEGFGSRALAESPWYFFDTLIGREWKETLSWASEPVEGLEGVVKLGDKYYYQNGQLLDKPYQEAAGKYYQQGIRAEELQGEKSKGWIEANELLAQRKQAYKDVQKEWSKSLETPWVKKPGEAFSTDTTMRGRELGIPERIWSDPNFQKAYEQNLAKIKEAQTRPFQKYGTADAEAYAAVPESTNLASEQMARKRALEGYAPPAPMTGRAAGYVSPPMGEDWVSRITPKRDEAAYEATQKKRKSHSRERARYALARQQEQKGLDKFKGFMQYLSGKTPDEERRPSKRRETPGDYGFGAMSTAEHQALMGEYEEKYDVNAWPTLPSGQSWYTMPWEQRGNVMQALTQGWPTFGEDLYKSKIPYSGYKNTGAFGKRYATPPKEWKPRYAAPEEALHFMNMAPYSSGLGTSRRATKQRA